MSADYRVKVFMVGVDIELARQLRDALGQVIRGAGKAELKKLMRRAHEGERILVYQSNDDNDAKDVAAKVEGAGAKVVIEGLKPPEDPF